MWDLRTLKRKNDEWVERMNKQWRGTIAIKSEENVDNMHPFPYYDPTVERDVFFASNSEVLPSVTEKELKDKLKEIWKEKGAYHLSMYSASRYEVRLIIWFG